MKYKKYFEKSEDDPNLYKCTLCKTSKYLKKAKDGSTSNFLKHLRNQHEKEYKEFLAEEEAAKAKQEKIRKKESLSFGFHEPAKLDQMGIKWPNESEHSVAIDEAIVDFLVSASLPISTIENEAFRALLNLTTKGKYKGRDFFSRVAIPEAMDKMKKEVSNALKDQPYISLTADGWSSKDATHSLLGVTCHWITSDFKLKGSAVAVAPVKGPHTALNYEDLLSQAMEEMKIDKKRIHMLVTDGAATMTCLSRNMSIKNLHCFSHNMQLAVNDFLDSLTDWKPTYATMGKISSHLHRSAISREEYVACLEVNDLEIRYLTKTTEVRWGSMYLLCERFLHARIAVQKLLKDRKKKPLTEAMWQQIKVVRDVLKPLNDVTKIVQHATASQCSVVIPYVRLLLMAYEDREDCEYSSKLYDHLVYRLKHYLNDEILQIGSAVDPRFKLDYLLDKDAKLEALVYEEMKKDREEEPTLLTSQELRTIEQESDLLERFRLKHGQRVVPSPDLPEAELKQAAAREVQYYLSERADSNIDCFKYWQDNKAKFPILALLARKYLSAPSTSSESERLFSAARMVLSDYRKKMNPETLEKMLYLKVNKKFKEKNNNI